MAHKFRPAITAVLLSGIIPVAMRLALLPRFPIPPPSVPDEFSYLLAADTFSHGALTNPPHPLWKFFESFFIIHHPTYMSMYPPMQGVVLAFGKIVFGHPFWGVCLSAALMCALVCWLLECWLPARWALAGSLLLSAKLIPPWANCYWGGAMATIGGCLVLGSFVKIGDRRTPPRLWPVYSTLLAVGVAVLANSRPWEGAIYSLPLIAALAWWIVRSGAGTLKPRLTRVVAPCLVVGVMTASAMAYYNWRITGSPWMLPYTLHWNTYRVEPLFIWQKARPAPAYSNEVLRRMYTEWEPAYLGANQEDTWKGWWKAKLTVHPMEVFLALLVCGFILRGPGIRLLAAVLAIFLLGLCLQRYVQLHYMGPILPVLAAVFMLLLQRISRWQYRGRLMGRLAAAVLFLAVFSAALASGLRSTVWYSWASGAKRAAMQSRLAAIPGKHVVVVRYGPVHDIVTEWVYNDADIDASRIVWARDMGSEANRQLRLYYPGRKIWLLQPDCEPPRLTPMLQDEQNTN